VSTLRDRLRAAVREGSLEEIYMEVAAVRDAADALERGA
jgi:ubiquinone biosynthesis protein UbiJ